MGLHQLGTILLLNLAGMLTPGPDIFLITRLATRSRIRGLAAAAGIATGLVVWVSLTVFGAATLLTAYPDILGWVQIVGGAWIVWMGIGMLRSARVQFAMGIPVASEAQISELFGTAWACYRQGLFTNLSNPKVVLYFAAIIAPLMPAEPSIAVALLVVAAICASAFAGFSLIALLISTNALRRRFMAFGPWLDLIAGVFFCVAGVALVLNGFAELH
ncbi:LysE family transporter [Corynebacterium sp. 35RC1]|nr:LysE family transporter [Corynebacterium sp. 35RC1]